MELSYKKTEKTPGNIPDEETQRRFEIAYRKYEDLAVKGSIHLIFYDPNHQLHNSINGKKRQGKGKNMTLKIKSNTGRERINILGGINAITHEFIGIITEKNCNKETTKEALMKIRNRYKNEKKIVLILDNARYQRAYEVQEFAKKLGIELCFLPPYSPNLNLIERVWKYFKAKISKNSYYKTFKEFVGRIEDFFVNFTEHKEKISNLVNGKFHIIKCV